LKDDLTNHFDKRFQEVEQHFDKKFQETKQDLENHFDKRFQELEQRFDKRFQEAEDRLQRHMNVLIEEMRSTVQLVTEQHSSLVERMDRLETRMDQMEAQFRVSITSQNLFQKQLAQLLSKHENRFDEHDYRVKEIEVYLGLN